MSEIGQQIVVNLEEFCEALGQPVHVASDAELLLRLAEQIRSPRGILYPDGEMELTDRRLATIRLALELEKRPSLAFTAMVEGWDRMRIVREMY